MKFTPWEFLLVFTTVYLTVQMHEMGHWIVLQIFHREPIMGFSGIVQKWDIRPLNPNGWIEISYPGIGTGWLHLGSIPESPFEWTLMLVAGPIVHPILILLGILIVKLSDMEPVRKFGLLLIILNGLRFLTNLVGYLNGSKGDFFFISFYSGIPEIFIVFLFVVFEFLGFIYGIFIINKEKFNFRRIWYSIVLSVPTVFMGLTYLNSVVVEEVDRGNPVFAPAFGWPLPILAMHIASVLVLSISLGKVGEDP